MILKDSNTICFDSGEGRIQVYKWLLKKVNNEDWIVFEKHCSLREHQISEVIDSNMVSVNDFKFTGKSKLFDVTKNKIIELPEQYSALNQMRKYYKACTYASDDQAFALSSTEQNLTFLFDEFRGRIEIVNHDCIDFVFYHDKKRR